MASDKMINITDSNFSQEVENSSTPVLVDFGATWCGPCKALGVTLDGMIEDYQGKVKFCYVDIAQAPMSTQKYAVSNVPTLILFNGGSPAGSLLGAQPKPKIAELLSLAK